MSVIDIAKTLISFDTSGPPTKEKPLALWIKDYLEDLGFNSTIQEVEKDRANVVAKIGENTSPGLVLSGHIDVVPAGDLKHWTVTDPYEPKIVNDKLYGRGAADMKGPDACILKAAKNLIKEDFKRQLTLSFTAGEDTGGWFVTNILEKELITPKDAKYGVVAEPSMMQIVKTHKGSGRAQIIINGRAAHSSVPELGINAIYKASDLIQEIKNLERKLSKDKHPLLGSTTIKPTLINGGFKNNIIPDKCEINLNLRAIPKHTGTKYPRRWLNEIIESLKEKDPEFDATVLSAYTRPALDISEKSEIVATLKEILETETIGVPYYTEAVTYTEKGIPTIICGPGNIDQAHKPNEYITLNQLKKGVKTFEILIKKTCI